MAVDVSPAESKELHELATVLRGWLGVHHPVSRTRSLIENGERYDRAAWAGLANDLALTGIHLEQRFGGAGAGRPYHAVVAREMGRVLMGGPYISTMVLAAEAVRQSQDEALAGELLPGVASGQLTMALAVVEESNAWSPEDVRTNVVETAGAPLLRGRKHYVLDGGAADVLVVVAREPDNSLSLFVADPLHPTVRRTPLDTLDPTRRAAMIDLVGTPARRLGTRGEGWEILGRVREEAVIFVANEQVGASEALLDMCVAHVRRRIQFGRPIGGFQAVQHLMADMALRTELARSAAWWAARQEPGSLEASHGMTVAGSYCSEALLQNALDTIQLHGGIGFTWDHDAHLYLRRARALAGLLGSPQQLRDVRACALAGEVSHAS